ncbi:phage tail protein [Salinicoccus roseus]|uniref:phage tail protein n=1 Tax=Salinicoccus roseus TaxID=45670 RepID=UPI002300F934|nr:phage tail protein [Salinicoccus roseus]
MTIDDSVAPLFVGKDYTLQIIDNFYANTMSYSKQQNNTERFLYFVNRHEAEFEIPIGTKTVRLKNEIGTVRRDIMIHEDDNLLDLQIDTDTSSFCTAIKGYYDFDDDGNPQQNTEYISPMADKYGLYWGQPVVDDRFNDIDAVREACRKKQEGTWKTSFTLNAELFDTPLNEGDKIRLVFPSKSINMLIRVVEINETFDRDGELVGATYTFGNERISAQYRKMQYDAIQDVRDIMQGKKPIPYSVLPPAVRQATEVINSGSNTQFYYRDNEIYGVNLDNPLGVTRYNANGIGFSQDGGQSYSNAITYLGVVTESLTAGTIDANRITIYGSNGTNRIQIDGDKIKVWDSSDPSAYTLISAGKAVFSKSIEIIRSDGVAWIQDGNPRFGSPIITKQNMDNGVERGRRDYSTNNSHFSLFEAAYGSHDGRYANFVLLPGLRSDSRSNSAHIEIIIEPSNVPSGVTINPITHRQIIYRDEPNDTVVLNIPMPPPTFEAISFFLKFKLDTDYSGNYAVIRTARCWVSA